MPIKIRYEHRRGRRKLDARELVLAAGQAAVDELSRALKVGVSPVDGSPRERKPDGKPRGYHTGRLANKIHLGKPHKNRHRATVTIELPSGQPTDKFREAFVDDNPDTLTTKGNVGRAIDAATRKYIEDTQTNG